MTKENKTRYDFDVVLLCTNDCTLDVSIEEEVHCTKGNIYMACIDDGGVAFRIEDDEEGLFYYSEHFKIADIANSFMVYQPDYLNIQE